MTMFLSLIEDEDDRDLDALAKVIYHVFTGDILTTDEFKRLQEALQAAREEGS